MSDHIDKTIQDLRVRLERAEHEVIRFKRTINDLCEVAGRGPMFQDAELSPVVRNGNLTFSNDAFYGKPLATCVKQILESRKAVGQGAATVDEMYQLLLAHGYHFEGKEENRKTILRTALRKNPDFHRLPHGGYGLRDWYDRIKGSRAESPDSADEAETAGGEAELDQKEGENDGLD